MRKITEVNQGVLIESDDYGFVELVMHFAKLDDVTTPEELAKWHGQVEDLIDELVIDGFKQLVSKTKYGRKERFDSALLVLQGGD